MACLPLPPTVITGNFRQGLACTSSNINNNINNSHQVLLQVLPLLLVRFQPLLLEDKDSRPPQMLWSKT